MITNKAFFKRNEARIGAEFLLKKALFVIINLSQNPHYICVFKNLPSWFTLSRIHRIGSFHVVVLQRTARKCTKTSNARAELLFCSLSLLFGDVLVAVAVVVCLSSLLFCTGRQRNVPRIKTHVHSHCSTH